MTLQDCLTRLHKALLAGDPRRRAPERRPRLTTEPLEDRVVPSTIVWTNRGQASDNFAAVFGANAPAARSVIDAAIDAWERVITDFNYSDGSNDFQLAVSMAGSGTGFGASAAFPGTILDGKPKDGSITISRGNDTSGDGDGDGAGWFLDPTPNDSSEFLGAIDNGFSGFPTGGGPAAGLNDLFTVMALELTHSVGVTSDGGLRYQTGGFLTNTAIADTAEGGGTGFFWTFNGPSIKHLMTSFDSGGGGTDFGPGVHSAGNLAGNTSVSFGGLTLFGADDTGNAIYGGTRYLVPNTMALVLKDAYDYDIALPETFGTFYAVLNEATGVLTVRGGGDNTVINNVNQGASSDNITVTRSGSSIVVSVDVGNDVPGTGLGISANDQQDAFVSVFDAGQVTSIVVQAGDGSDAVTIGSDLGIPVSVDGQAGNDTLIGGDVTLIGGAGDDYLYGSTGNDSLTGGTGNDTIYGLDGNDTIAGGSENDTIYAGTGNNTVTDGTGNDYIDLSQNSVAVNYATGGGSDTVIGTAFNDVLNGGSGIDRLEGRGGSDQIDGNGGADQLFGGDDSDTFVWDPGDGSDFVEGETGTDVLVFNGAGGAEVFTLSAVGARFELLRDVGLIDMDVAGVEQVNLNALGGVDATTVNDLTQTEVQVVNVNVGAGDADGVTVNGRTVADNLLVTAASGVVTTAGLEYDVNVSAATAADTLTVNGNDGDDAIKAAAGVEAAIAVVLNGGNGNDSLSADATLNGGADNDVLVGGAGNDALNGGDGDDVLDGRGGSNALDGGAGTDTILVGGTAGADAITTTQAAVGSFAVAGGPSAGTNTIANMEAVRVEAGGGQDNVTLNLLPAGNLSYAVLGGADNDVATLVATAGDDTIVVSGQSVALGSSVVTAVGVEDLRLDAGGGTDLLSYSGVNGVAEDVQFLASATANAGTLRVVAAINLAFANVETADATGNPTDDDRLTFAGTDALDRLEIDLSAAGTAADPVLRLLNGSGATLLTFLNYTDFDTLRVNTLDGEDVINVYTDATAPGGGRNLFVDGGLPSGKKKSTDKLTVFYTPPRPAITHSTETQDPDNGLIDLDYDTARFLVQYADIEAVVIRRL